MSRYQFHQRVSWLVQSRLQALAVRIAIAALGEKGWRRACDRWSTSRTIGPKGRQDIPETPAPAGFVECLNSNYLAYRADFEPSGYAGWRYTNSVRSFTHYLYSVAAYFACRTIYEIGTYRAASTMMLLNGFERRGVDEFRIHTVDVTDLVDARDFSRRTRANWKKHATRLVFQLGDSTKLIPSRPYDLAIIDGSHRPEDVWLDFKNALPLACYLLFDDLHLGDTFDEAYVRVLATPGVSEVFRVYTTDDEGRDPHCIGLVRTKT